MSKLIMATAASLSLTAGVAQSQDVLETTLAFGQNLPILETAAVDFANKVNGVSTEVDVAFATSGYWQGKMTAASLFAAVPFGPETGEYLGWVLYDDGSKLLQKMYDTHGCDVQMRSRGPI
ncbi:MAG: hypothetical protein ABJL99_04875 [Aliishimia sp.]